MKMMHRSAAALALAVACTLLMATPTLVEAQVKRSALMRAYDVVESQQKTIALFMHPTATLRSLAFQSFTEVGSGNFRLEYAFNFEALYGRRLYTTLKFTFFANGSLDAIAVGERSAVIAPFIASDVVLNWVKSRLAEDSDLRDNPELARTLATFDSRQTLEWWLKAGR